MLLLENPAGSRQIALPHEHIADLDIADVEIALIRGVLLCEFFANREPIAVTLQRPRQVALREEHIADLIVRD